jgi:hypothetical protein
MGDKNITPNRSSQDIQSQNDFGAFEIAPIAQRSLNQSDNSLDTINYMSKQINKLLADFSLLRNFDYWNANPDNFPNIFQVDKVKMEAENIAPKYINSNHVLTKAI